MRSDFVAHEVLNGLRRNVTMTIAMVLTTAISLALVGTGLLRAAHDASVGGLAVALSRMAIASGCGASVHLEASTVGWFGERVGRIAVAVAPGDAAALVERCTASGVPLTRLGTAGGSDLLIDEQRGAVAALGAAWETPL